MTPIQAVAGALGVAAGAYLLLAALAISACLRATRFREQRDHTAAQLAAAQDRLAGYERMHRRTYLRPVARRIAAPVRAWPGPAAVTAASTSPTSASKRAWHNTTTHQEG